MPIMKGVSAYCNSLLFSIALLTGCYPSDYVPQQEAVVRLSKEKILTVMNTEERFRGFTIDTIQQPFDPYTEGFISENVYVGEDGYTENWYYYPDKIEVGRKMENAEIIHLGTRRKPE